MGQTVRLRSATLPTSSKFINFGFQEYNMKGESKKKASKETASKIDRDRGASRSSSLDVVVEEDGEERRGNGRRRDDDINDSPHNSPSQDIHLPHIDLTKRSSTRKKDKAQMDSNDKAVSSQPPGHDPAPKRRDSRSGGSSEVANEDIYGISRGKCNECGQCEVYMTAASGLPTQSCYRILCLYCGCPPAYHEVIGSTKAAKRSISDNIAAGEASSKKGKKKMKSSHKSEKKAVGQREDLSRDD